LRGGHIWPPLYISGHNHKIQYSSGASETYFLPKILEDYIICPYKLLKALFEQYLFKVRVGFPEHFHTDKGYLKAIISI
jgi:hypothetical protein